MADFFAQLRRGRICRVGAAYVVVAWAISQVVEWSGRFGQSVLVLLAIGFPITLILAWTTEGKGHGAVPSAKDSKMTSVNWMLACGLVGVLAATVYQQRTRWTFEIFTPLATAAVIVSVPLVAAEMLSVVAVDRREIDGGVQITDHGAIANDDIDDTAAIERAIQATPNGGTTSFPAGKYLISSAIQLDSNKKYLSDGAVLEMVGGPTRIFQILDGTNIVVQGLTFDGAGIRLTGSLNEKVDIVGNTFQNIFVRNAVFGDSSAITIFGDRYLNSYIQANIFLNIGHRNGTWIEHAEGILGFHFDSSHVLDNQFDRVAQPISLIWEGVGGNTIVARNHVTSSHRMAIELRGDAEGITVQENIVNDPYAGMGLSIVMNAGHTSKVLDNEINGLNTPNESEWFAMAIESAGVGTLVEGNTIRGNWDCFICIGGPPPQYSTARNNYACGYNSIYDPINVYEENPSIIEGNVVDDVCTTISGAVAEPSPSRATLPEGYLGVRRGGIRTEQPSGHTE